MPDPSIQFTLYGYGNVHPTVLMAWSGLANRITALQVKSQVRMIREDALISRSRCRGTKWFLDTGLDVWVQLDHDLEFVPEDVLEMARIAHERQACVCIPYPCRSLPPRPALRPKIGATRLPEDNRLTPITLFASGAVAIPREALVKALGMLESKGCDHPLAIDWCADSGAGSIPTLWMPFAAPVGDVLEYLSEDYAASYRLAACDIPQLMYEPSKPLNHWGEYPFSLPQVDVPGITMGGTVDGVERN